MSQLMKKRQDTSHRMNGLNDPGEIFSSPFVFWRFSKNFFLRPFQCKAPTTATMNCNSWPAPNRDIPMSFPSQPTQLTAQQPFPRKSHQRASEKEVSIKSLLQQSCLHQSRPQSKAKISDEQIPSYNIPEMSYQAMEPDEATAYGNKSFEPLKATDDVLPEGAYYGNNNTSPK